LFIVNQSELSHAQHVGQVSLAVSTCLFLWWNRSWSLWFRHRSGRGRSRTGWSTSGGTASGGRTGVAAAINNLVSAQAKSLFSLTSHATIAVAQSTGQGGDDFGAAAAVTANLITDLVCSRTTNSFISIVQSIDEGRHDFWIADAVISIAKLTESSSSLTSIASRLRGVDQLGDITRIGIAADRGSTARCAG
jgi:hypothetical protein